MALNAYVVELILNDFTHFLCNFILKVKCEQGSRQDFQLGRGRGKVNNWKV